MAAEVRIHEPPAEPSPMTNDPKIEVVGELPDSVIASIAALLLLLVADGEPDADEPDDLGRVQS